MKMEKYPTDYIPQSWRVNNKPFSYCLNDKITRAYNFINQKDRDE